MNIPKLLSKSKLMRGYQCPKSLYLTLHHKELEPPISAEQQAIFDQGTEVGIEARKYFPNGILVDNKPWDFIGSLKRTRELLAQKTAVIYEAAFEYKGCYARADIICFNPYSNRWNIYEVKSTTKLKEEHLDDVALQVWIMSKSGLEIEQIHLLHLNPSCQYPDLSNLFVSNDVTEQVRQKYLAIPDRLNKIYDVIRSENVPEIDIGAQCTTPNDCPFMNHCFSKKNIPEMSVFNLPNLRNRKWELYQQGIVDLKDQRLSELSPLQERVVECFRENKRYIHATAIREAVHQWKFPLIFLDFETINPAIPKYQGMGPYRHLPFQFSAHIWAAPEADLIHKEYLHTDSSDPRPTLIPRLLEACGTEGSIVAYYSQFESERILELASYSPEHSEALQSLLPRTVDPLPILREYVYDNQFMGSFSLKKVGPALLGQEASYQDMLVGDGTAAQRAFAEIIRPQTSEQRREELIKASLKYCGKDTLVLVNLTKWMLQL